MKIYFKKINIKKEKLRGFMMVEIMIATSIMLIITIATMSVVQKGILISHQSLHSVQASFLLEEGGEAVRIFRDSAWSNISNLSLGTNYYPTFSGNTWTLSATPNNIDNFTRTVTLGSVNRDASTGDIVSSGGILDSGTKLITVNVSWQENGQTISKKLLFYIFDIFS